MKLSAPGMDATATNEGGGVPFLTASTKGRAQVLIRIAVGLIFFTQGILKYTDPHMGVLRFARIGFPWPDLTAHFVGTFEIACGLLVLAGWRTRWACLPLLAVILTAIATTKVPALFRPQQGLWYVVSEARTDFSMCLSLVFLLCAGGGQWSLEARPGARQGRPPGNSPAGDPGSDPSATARETGGSPPGAV